MSGEKLDVADDDVGAVSNCMTLVAVCIHTSLFTLRCTLSVCPAMPTTAIAQRIATKARVD